MSCCTPTCQKWTIFSLGSFLLVLGIVAVLFTDDIVDLVKEQELNLGSDSTTEFNLWKETPIPMYIEFYLFNLTNWEEVIRSDWTEKPSFEEKGPYTYTEKHIRRDVIFNHNRTLTYKTERVWHFLPEKSNGTLDDEITTLNAILVTVGNIVQFKHAIVRMGVNFFLEEKQVNLTVTKKVREFLFDGYEDPLLDLLKKLHLKTMDIPYAKFGWFAMRNESKEYDGVFNMYDGTDHVRKLGRFTAWNYASRTEMFPSYCGDVNGTSGELWYPVQDDTSIQVFASDICSTVTLYHDGEDERYGVKGHKYVGDERVFDNGTKYPEMACFSPGEVLHSGVRNMSACKFHAPAFVSYPHFYLADPYYRDQIVGMNPNKSKHQFFVSIEPETGIPIQAHAAFQLNLRLFKVDRIKLLEKVKEHFIPALWFKQYAKLDENLASQAKLILIIPDVGEYTGYALIGIGALLIVAFGYITLRNHWKGTEEEELLNQETM